MEFVGELVEQVGWNPGSNDRILIAGDESALPIIRTILPTLDSKSRGQIFVEVQSVGDIEVLTAPGRFGICWLVRDRGQSLRRSVDAWLSEMLPISGLRDHEVYAWIAPDGAARLLNSN